jgi:ketosteroid isomerase-like protein
MRLTLVVVALIAATIPCVAQPDATTKMKAQPADQSQADRMLIENSRSTWEAYKGRNIAAIKALTAEDYVAFTLGGPSNLQQDIDTLDKLSIESYSIDQPKVTWATKDVGILRYRCDLKGSFAGKPFTPVFATEVWVNRGGKWQIVSYSETPARQP